MGKVLIAIVYFVPRHEQDLLSQKEKKKKEGIKLCSLISWVVKGELYILDPSNSVLIYSTKTDII